MLVKENQGGLRDLLALLLDSPVAGRIPVERAITSDVGHGRIEQRTLISSRVLAGRVAWPGLEQIFRLERRRRQKKSGVREEEVVYGITSLAPALAGPAQLLELVRGHWLIENRSHWVRDVTFEEDRSQAHSGSIPQVMAALRNAAIGRMRQAGHRNIASACRYYAAQPWKALALLGITCDN
jgi:predicted transposase YbfD/YdcC